MIEPLLDGREVATLLRVKPCTVRNERGRGKIGFVRVGARIFYTLEQVQEYYERQKVKPCASQNLNWDKLEITGSVRNRGENAKSILGAELGTTSNLDRRVVSALAQQTFGKPVKR